jgi:hypothetical protein
VFIATFLILSLVMTVNFLASFYYLPGDLDTFVVSGKAASDGVYNPYSIPSLRYDIPLYNRNPPFSLLFFMPLSKYTTDQIFPMLYCISLILIVLSIILLYYFYNLKVPFEHVGVVLASSGLWIALSVGQIYVFLLFAIVLAWIFIKRQRYIYAGILIGFVIAIKPNFVIWAILLFVGGNYILAVASLMSALFFTLLPMPFLGLGAFTGWIEMNFSADKFGGLTLVENGSILGVLNSVGLLWVGYILVVLFFAGSALWVYFKRPDIETISRLSLSVSLLANPLAWNMWSIVLFPFYFTPKRNNWFVWSAILFMIPPPVLHFITENFPSLKFFTMGTVYFAAFFFAFVSVFVSSTTDPSYIQTVN